MISWVAADPPDLRPTFDATELTIRLARENDWQHIWPFFSAIVEAGETIAYPEPLTPTLAKSLWFGPPPDHTVVAGADGAILGSARMGPNRPGRGSHVATATFMVDPGCRGRGVGRALGEYALAWARAHRYRAMQFNAVVATNENAIRLWKSLGFDVIGTVPEAFDHRHHGLVGLHVMYQRL